MSGTSTVPAAIRLLGVFTGRGRNPSYSFIDYWLNGVKAEALFVHRSDIDGGQLLPPGTRVSFEIGVEADGRPHAVRVFVRE